MPRLRPLRIGEILDVALKLYFRNIATLVAVVAVVVIPIQILTVLVAASTTPDRVEDSPFEPISPGEVPRIDPTEVWTFVAANGAAALLGLIGALLASAACFKAVADAYLGSRPEWRGSLGFAARRLGAIVWLALLSFVLLVPAFIALLIPGIWLFVAWSVAQPGLLTEDVRGRRALGRSFRLVRGRWWPTAGALGLGFLLTTIAAGVIEGGLLLFEPGDSLFVSLVASGVAGIISSVLTTPFQAALIAIVYFDLRVRKEGFDLELLARTIGVAPGSPAPDFLPPPPSPGGSEPPFWPPPPGWRPSPPPPPPE